MSAHRTLSGATLRQASAELASREPRFARIIEDYGAPPLWARRPGFPTLLRIILEQQVSLESARAAYDKLLAVAAPLTPERFLQLSDTELKESGFSGQKAGYGRNLARAVASGDLDLKGLQRLDEAAVRAELVKIKGIGRWTADVYLLMALRRPDIFPVGDQALAVALQRAFRLRALPGPGKMDSIARAWKPWRAVAARLLWHFYLSSR